MNLLSPVTGRRLERCQDEDNNKDEHFKKFHVKTEENRRFKTFLLSCNFAIVRIS